MASDAFLIRPDGGVERRTTEADAAIIKGMLVRGDRIQDVSAYWGCNNGRIAETKRPYLRRSRQHPPRYKHVKPAPLSVLPPPGPPMAHAKAATIQITGVAEKFWQSLQRMERKVDQLQVQLAGFGRRVGLIEDPKMPRIGKRRPMEG
jgi:hypothetical protein